MVREILKRVEGTELARKLQVWSLADSSSRKPCAFFYLMIFLKSLWTGCDTVVDEMGRPDHIDYLSP